jgi:hypothetical protein
LGDETVIGVDERITIGDMEQTESVEFSASFSAYDVPNLSWRWRMISRLIGFFAVRLTGKSRPATSLSRVGLVADYGVVKAKTPGSG